MQISQIFFALSKQLLKLVNGAQISDDGKSRFLNVNTTEDYAFKRLFYSSLLDTIAIPW